jgi:molecular chaperone DnaK
MLMSRDTVDFGIDLGTTNSAIAVLRGVETEVIKNNDGLETTPSAVWLDRRERLYVGKAARERSELDPDNTCVEFKLRMGTVGQPKTFAASGRSMSPEELSAEVLKSLRRDVTQRTGEEIGAAVITVPAAFELNACDATRRAAETSGLTYAPLLQEPTAAALAHGFQSSADNVFWLVYDFGGGTFDAAVVHVRDGEFTVVNHRGDNFLGGKLIDWKIVEDLLIPAVTAQGRFAGLARGNPRWLGAVSKLKMGAEDAKIQVSRADSAEILVELQDEDGRVFEFEYELARADVERLTEPYIARSVNLCRNALSERGLGPGDVEKVLLVGGPTLSPYLRERLADPREGLGIPLDHTLDPITAVARGAAIFAGTQRLPAAAPALSASTPPAGEFSVELAYRPVGPDREPFIGGRVTGGGTAGLAGYTVEFVNSDARPAWRSGKIALAPDGAFTATLWADTGRANSFAIEVADATGTLRPVTPDRLTYTVGVVGASPPLTHSIGVGLADNKVKWLISRQTPLPTRHRTLLRTTVELKQGQDQGMIRIPVLEGEHDRADRNRQVGRIEIVPGQVRRDVPAGSEIDFTIAVDESRLVVARAYIPILDEEFEHVVNLQTEQVPDQPSLAREVQAEKRRLAALRRANGEVRDARVDAVLQRIDDEGIIADIDALVSAAAADPDAATASRPRLLVLRTYLDEGEDALEWPQLVKEAGEVLVAARDLVNARGNADHKRALASMEDAVQSAIAAHDASLLRQRLDDLRVLGAQVLEPSGELIALAFGELRDLRSEMTNPDEARQLISTGEQAIAKRDFATLRQVNYELASLLHKPPPPSDPFSTVRGG